MSQQPPQQPPQKKARVVPAPTRPDEIHRPSVFLAGTITPDPGWREELIDALSHLPVTIFNPHRKEWGDENWRDDVAYEPFKTQVEWELDMQEHADVVVVYYGPGTDAPISLLELGLCARSGKAIVACHKDYKRRGNVYIVSQRLGIDFLDAEEDYVSLVVEKLQRMAEANGRSA